ncbi:MAG: FHA domain-containing protein [Deltaproteobacteria bacterium]|nr:MAG: FHA domain-containing protein [Deltaproteobacteria bacterium]
MAMKLVAVASGGTRFGAVCQCTVDSGRVVAGRGRAAGLRMLDPTVSPSHFAVEATGEGFLIEDLGSRLGTRLNGAVLEPHRPIPLRPGDRIRAGVFSVYFTDDRNGLADLETGSGSPGEADKTPRLVGVGRFRGTELVLGAGRRFLVGRGPDCHLQIDDMAVSRTHAELELSRRSAWLKDLGSSNGTWLNGRRLEAGKRKRIRNGDVVSFGRCEMRFELPSLAGAPTRPLARKADLVAGGLLAMAAAGGAGLVAALLW